MNTTTLFQIQKNGFHALFAERNQTDMGGGMGYGLCGTIVKSLGLSAFTGRCEMSKRNGIQEVEALEVHEREGNS